MKTFHEISSLARQMVEKSTLTARREACQRLYDRLSNPEIRYRLASEAPSFKALKSVWELIVTNVVLGTQKIQQKTAAGIKNTDMHIAFQLIQLADRRYSDEVYTTAAAHPEAPPEMARYRDAFLLGNKTVRNVFNFCFDLLDDERACDMGENQILRMLAGMLAQTGYVKSFKNQSEMQNILEEVEKRILPDDDDDEHHVTHDIQVSAAEVFRNLLRTTTVDLQMELPVLVASSIKLVAAFCIHVVTDTEMKLSTHNIFSPLLDGITCLIRINPEQACEPMKRHGRVILKFAKKVYRQALDRHQRDVVHDYFLAHLLVLQVAGQMQGLLPGDLGDLGDASFSLRWIDDTIDMLIGRYSDVSDETGAVESRLGESRLKHLELIAHLLACGQRMYLCEAELATDALSAIMQKVVESNLTRTEDAIQTRGIPEDLPPVAPETLLQSPFWKIILVPLLCGAPQSPRTFFDKARGSKHYGKLLAALDATCKRSKPPSRTLTRHLLQIVAVCAKQYPAGACWTTNSHSSWFELPLNHEEEGFLETQAIMPPRYIQGSSTEDLAVLVNVLCGIMTVNGGMTGDNNLQVWSTRTLECLTLPTSFLSVLCENSSFHEVQEAWRRVWSILFRKDLRYHPCTNDCSPFSHGVAVASLIASLAENMCMDLELRWSNDLQARHTSFLAKNEGVVWNLPLFAKSSDTSIGAASRVLVAVGRAVGVHEGEDTIGRDQKEISRRGVKLGGRRGRLINYFLVGDFMQNREVTDTSTASLAFLAGGSVVSGAKDGRLSPRDAVWVTGTGAAVSTNLSGEWKDLPLTDPAVSFPLPSTAPSGVFRRVMSRMQGSVSSADLIGETTQVILVDSLHAHFRASFDALTTESQTGDDTLQKQICVMETILLLLHSTDSAVAQRFTECCKGAGVLIKAAKSSILSSSPPTTECLKGVARVLKRVIRLGALYDLPLSGGFTISGDELCTELLGLIDEYPRKDSGKSKSSSSGISIVFDSDEELADDSDRKSRKRSGRRMSSSSPSKRKRNLSSIIARLRPVDVFVCADIVLSLRPTPRTFKKVVQGLTGAEIDRLWALHGDELDSAALLYVLWLVINHSIRCEEDRLESIVTMSLSVMKSIQHCAVSTAGTTDYCLCACFQIFQYRLRSDKSRSITSGESAELLALLTEIDPAERRIRNLRSITRVQSVRLASSIFLHGGSDLRDQWGKSFASLVLPGICDSSALARRQSSYSVSDCLTSTGNESYVMESTLRNMYTAEPGQKSFKEWYTSFSPRLDVPEEQMWEDLHSSVSCSSLLSMALIGGRSTLAVDQAKVYTRLLEIAGHIPKHEGLCFLVLEKMARLGGYESIEALTRDCAKDFLWLWSSKGEKGPFIDKLPLILTSPGTVRFALKTGWFKKYGDEHLDGIRSDAASDFAARSQSLFPLLLSNVKGPTHGDASIQDFLSIFENTDVSDQNSVVKVARQFVPGMCALSLCLKWGSKEDQRRGHNLVENMKEIMPEEKLEQYLSKNAGTIISEVFHWIGSPFVARDASTDEVKDGVVDFVRQFGDVGANDPFHYTGLSCLELFLFASGRLRRNRATCRAPLWLRPFVVVTAILLSSVRSGGAEYPPVGFLFSLVSELLTHDYAANIVEELLLASKEVMSGLLDRLRAGTVTSLISEANQDMKILLISVVGLHGRSQMHVLEFLRSSFRDLRQFALSSMGIDSYVNEDGTISRSMLSSNLFSNELSYFSRLLSLVEERGEERHLVSLESTYDLTKWMAENADSLGICIEECIDTRDSADLAVLDKLNERFTLRHICKAEPVASSPSVTLRAIRLLLESREPIKAIQSHRHRHSPPMRLLQLQLESLARSLSTGAMISAEEVMPTVRLLAKLNQGVPSREMIALSVKCLGELRRSVEHWRCSNLEEGEEVFETPGTPKNSMLALEAKCIEVLARRLGAEDHEKAIVACETLGVLLKRKHPADFSRLLKGKTLRTLQPFFSRKNQQGSKIMSIDRSSTSQLKHFFGGATTWVDWCWNVETWRNATTTSYESWVCLVGAGMILCRQESSNGDKSRESLDHFLRMAYMDAEFSAALFPLCILRSLIDESAFLGDENSVEYDTWIGSPDSKINELVSKCFTALLSAFLERDTGDYRAASLVLDTLDMLRTLTQLRFLQSDKHVANDRLKKLSPTDSSQGSSSPVFSEANGTTTWRGVLYGVVLRVDGLLIARTCVKVGRYASARFYAEAYADARFGGSTKATNLLSGTSYSNACPDISGFGRIPRLDETTDSADTLLLEDACRFLNILRQCSLKDDEQSAEAPALEGLISDLSLATSSSDRGWYRVSALSPLDEIRRLGFESASSEQTSSVVDCLQKLCVPNVLQSFVMGQTLLNGNDALQPDTYPKFFESCLEDPRLFDVDEALSTETSTTFERLTGIFSSNVACFQELFLSGLSSYAKDDMRTCDVRLEASRERMVSDLAGLASREATWQATQRVLDQASALQDLDTLVHCAGNRDRILESWVSDQVTDHQSALAKKFLFPVSDFTREVALRIAVRRASNGTEERLRRLCAIHRNFLWKAADGNRSSGRVDKCEALLTRLRSSGLNESQSAQDILRFGILEADIQEARGGRLLAIQTMKQIAHWLARSGAATHDAAVLAEGIIDLGTRLSTHKAETGEVILKEYFEPGIVLAKRHLEGESLPSHVLCSGYLAQADLLVNLYQIVSSRVAGPEWMKVGKSLVERERELREMDEVAQAATSKKKQAKKQGLDRDLSIYRITVRKEVANAREARQKIEKSVSDFLLRATESIVEALAIAGTDMKGIPKYVYRLISIWFGTAPSDIFNDMHHLFASAVGRIPTYRFVPLTNQLFARLGTSDHFSTNLEILSRRMCIEHPYHCVIDMVRLLGDDSQIGKMNVAEDILSQVKSESTGFLQPLVEGYKMLSQTYISFASLDPTKLVLDRKRRTRMAALPRACRLDECLGKGTRRRPFPPCILTKPPPIRPDGNYENAEVIVGFDDSFSLAESGLARPKIVVCIGSNGTKHRQLVKGGDDCRGDCVMEQVFRYVNGLFRNQTKLVEDQSIEKNNIITYNIVPLNRKTGVLEWVENTMPFSDFVSDKGASNGVGAHSRYYPAEWGFKFCREYLDRAPVKHKRKAFDDILSHHSPSFRFFFVERFGQSPQAWFNAKMKFSRSVAVSSFVGHVLGIGDRHGSNILIHRGTGEVVHIDFGIVFEQGKVLNCPEKVPFRLTQNIVDGLGPTEHEGVFTSAAESTLSVLRQHADSLLTILSAVVNDPLYKWSVSPMQARRRQRIVKAEEAGPSGKASSTSDEDLEDRNEAAEHAIRRVREKLNGYEDGTSGEQQTIEGQVRFLIRAARDVDDLATMYPGWAPWM